MYNGALHIKSQNSLLLGEGKGGFLREYQGRQSRESGEGAITLSSL